MMISQFLRCFGSTDWILMRGPNCSGG
jgi:hypothetical protein